MTFLRKISLFVALLLLLETSFGATICLTGRVVKNFPSYGLSFMNAAQLAVSKYKSNHLKIKLFFYNNLPLAPILAYKEMINNNCDAIIGYEYLSDLLLIARSKYKAKIPIFTSYASTLGKNNLPKNIFIFRPSYQYLARKMIHFLLKKYSNFNHVLLVTEISRDSMSKYKQAYIEQFKESNVSYQSFDFLENEADVIDHLKRYIGNKKYKYIFLLSGAVAAIKIANFMNHKSHIFIGTENYGSSSSESFYAGLHDKSIRSFFIRNIDFLSADRRLTRFYEMYEHTYHVKPLLLSAYTYDAVSIILNALKKYQKISVSGFLKESFYGASGVKILNNKFYRSKKFVILKLSPHGYVCAR